MRYARIFLSHFQEVIELRSRSFVWFLVPLFESLIFLLFWVGVIKGRAIEGWTLPSIASYYLFLVIAGTTLISHVETDVWYEDIKEGRLVNYLTKPISYFWIKFFEETPYRLLQGFYGVILLLLVFLLFNLSGSFSTKPMIIFLSCVIAIFGYFLSFFYKLMIGMLAFWFTEISGFYELQEIFASIAAGFVIPLSLLPSQLANIFYALPFSYMVYFPIVAFQGKLGIEVLIRVIITQTIWLIAFFFLYKFMWKSGIKIYSGVGQ